jgi:hypothetical protein
MTVRDVTKLLALKLRLSNPQEFTLVALVDGQGPNRIHSTRRVLISFIH